MRHLVFIAICVVLVKAVYSAFDPNVPGRLEQRMRHLAHQLNQDLPQIIGDIRVERVEYAESTMRLYSALLNPDEIPAEEQPARARMSARDHYCRSGFYKSRMNVVYSFRHVVLRSFYDSLQTEDLWITLKPSDC